MKRSLRTTLVLSVATPVLAGGLLAGPPSSAQVGAQDDRATLSAGTPCYRREEIIRTTKGRAVFLPSSLVTSWRQAAGSRTISWSEGHDFARTRGTSRSQGGSVGVSMSGFEASYEYAREHGISLTGSTSFSDDVSDTYEFSSARSRLRWYQKGREFLATKTMYFTNCPSLSRTWLVRMPIPKNNRRNRMIAVETWSNRGRALY